MSRRATRRHLRVAKRGGVLDNSGRRTLARHALEHLLNAAGYRSGLRVETGDVPKVVAQLAGEMKADLLVIGRKSEAGVLGRLDMTAYSIIRESPCPVVSV